MVATILECDENIEIYYDKLKNDPEAKPDYCWRKINFWLDRRINVMERHALQSGKGREEVFSK